MNERVKFCVLADNENASITHLCKDFDISRKTGYKWLARYRLEGPRKMEERSRRARHYPNQTSEEVEQLIILERKKHKSWGPKKLQWSLAKNPEIENLPARSTIGEILRRNGLSQRRRRKPGLYHVERKELSVAQYPNHVWAVDFKGWFLTSDGERCDPLTTSDLYSRYLLCCKAQTNQQHNPTLRSFRALMRHHGLPEIIRVDNGTPFASMGIGGLSRLSVWWILQGIQVEFTRPGKPQDNGSHERMHKTLKAEATKPASVNLRAQQRRFERWRKEFNYERPHEAIRMQCPAELYHPSTRRLNENDNPLIYPEGFEVRSLVPNGVLNYGGEHYFVGEALGGVKVGLEHLKDGRKALYFANTLLGYLKLAKKGEYRARAYIEFPFTKPLARSRSK